MPNLSTLYDSCLQAVCLLLRDEMWTGKVKPFHFLPQKIIEALISTSLELQQLNGFKAQDLKLLFTSGRIRELKLDIDSFSRLDNWNPTWRRKNIEIQHEFCQALKFLTTASGNLEIFELLNYAYFYKESPQLSEALNGLLKNSPNLKHLHSKVKFDLKALRNCKSIQSIMLHFDPRQPWYDFLEEEQGSFKPLLSIKSFMICDGNYSLYPSIESKYLDILLRHCPSLTSLGNTETSRALANLYRSGFQTQVKLRTCRWGRGKQSKFNPTYIPDAVLYHPFVEELRFEVYSIQSVSYLKCLKSLYLLEILDQCQVNLTEELGNVLKEIGSQLKYLLLSVFDSTDVSVLLNNCPNLEVLKVSARSNPKFSESAVSLPNLKSLSFFDAREAERCLMSVLYDCHSLKTIFSSGLKDKNFGVFLKRNYLLNLKTAFIESRDLSTLTFKEFLLSAPNLEKIEIKIYGNYERENELKNVLQEINHKARFNEGLVSRDDEFFHKRNPRKNIGSKTRSSLIS